MRPTVLLDVDGVVADFVSFYLDSVRVRLDRQFLPSDVTQWDLGDALGLTDAEREVVHVDLFSPGAASAIDPYPAALTGVPLLQQVAEVVFVTSHLRENPTWVSDRDRWLREHFGEVPVVHTHNKEHVWGNMLVDDKPSNLSAWERRRGESQVGILWDCPWNQGEYTFFRTSSWEKLASIAAGL